MTRPFTIAEIRDISVPIAKKCGVAKLALFGSYAKGTANEYSDVDFLIDKGVIVGLEYIGFILDLEDELGVHVDVMTYNALKRSLIADVIEDEVTLYEQ